MYKFFNRFLTLLFLIAVVTFSIRNIMDQYKYMYAEGDATIAVNKAKLDIEKDIEEIAQKSEVLIAKQIMTKSTDGKSSNQPTFQTFGEGKLPEQWSQQKSKKIIENSPDDVLYFILGDGLSGQELVEFLNQKGNEAIIYRSNWHLSSINMLFIYPSLALGLFLIVLALMSLIFAEKVSEFKRLGVERLSGLSNWKIAFKDSRSNFNFLVLSSLLLSFLAYAYLFLNNLSNRLYFEIILVSITLAFFMLALNNLISIFIIYFILKNQNIHQAIKGYVPVKLLTFVILFVQLLSVIGLVFSLSSVLNSQVQINELERAETEWKKVPDWFAPNLMASLSFRDFDQENLYNFLKESQEKETVMLAVDNLDYSQEEVVFPSFPNDVSNYLYVSPNFLTEQNVNSELTGTEMSKNTAWIIIPKSQVAQKDKLAEVWTKEIVSNFDEKGYPIEDLELIIKSATYDDSEPIFSYRILESREINYQMFSLSPVLLVINTDSWIHSEKFTSYFTSWISQQQLIFSDPELTTELIEKYNLQDNMGSYTNGLYAVQSEIIKQQTSQIYLTLSALTAMATSLLLLSILNSIYFYQNRRKFVIQRLAGMSDLAMHWKYLLTIVFVLLLVSVVLPILGLNLLLELVPALMLVLVLSLFYWQLQARKKEMLDSLKGE
ncbi:MAG: DUF1430 domain-containing protein [Lactovum sp.]